MRIASDWLHRDPVDTYRDHHVYADADIALAAAAFRIIASRGIVNTTEYHDCNQTRAHATRNFEIPRQTIRVNLFFLSSFSPRLFLPRPLFLFLLFAVPFMMPLRPRIGETKKCR